ncbi:N-acetyllactosaminide beta-1,3-N-acetylglucosaminyltransferase 3-like [Protopterus annectens]|uniref:N-acetyllactosaminide beta-1,3-N-acetylglucosaminyltransferase 3-like n=1 Tax=Protopterus annectens TaxID=7888 RepID=UPI001CF9A760|nr:N-acetyllactosaminide beta-1,3-N-acetylglucosaminyltransferase 3-like [Protopterus annectens]
MLPRYVWRFPSGFLVVFTLVTFFFFLGRYQTTFKGITKKMEMLSEQTQNTSFTFQSVNTSLQCKENTSVANIKGFSGLFEHIKDFLKYKHCRNFPIIHDAPMKCGGSEQSDKIFLLLVIKSSPKFYTRRQTIRKTWGEERKYEGVQIRLLFILGVHSDQKESKKLQQLLSIESKENGDILQWDFYDTFFNLTLKQVLFFAWLQQNCPHVNFLLNADDDVFVNSDAVVQYLLSLNGNKGDKHLFVGQLVTVVFLETRKSSKYYVPEQVTSRRRFPPYCAGGGYLLSAFTARHIHKASLNVAFIPIDDIYIGMCLDWAGLKPELHVGIQTGDQKVPSNFQNSFDPCYYKELLVFHRFTPYEIFVMWKAIHDPDTKCGFSPK